MRNIPKFAFFYWGNTVLPFLRFISIASFKKMNPDWRVILFTPTKLTTKISWKEEENREKLKTQDYMSEVSRFGIYVEKFDFSKIGYSNDLSEVIKSDILRTYLLHIYGGLWTDIDILYYRPLWHSIPETIHQAFFCYRRGGPTQEDLPINGPLYHTIGFLMGSKNNSHFRKLFKNIPFVLNEKKYQSIGSSYYKEQVDMTSSDIYNIDIDVVYPIRSPQELFVKKANQLLGMLKQNSIGLHWYAGYPECCKMQNEITHQNYKEYDNIVCKIISDLKIC